MSCWRRLCINASGPQPPSTLIVVPRFTNRFAEHLVTQSESYGHAWDFLESFFECVLLQGPSVLGVRPEASVVTVALPSGMRQGLPSPLFALAQKLFSMPGSLRFPSRPAGVLIVSAPWLTSCQPCVEPRRLLSKGTPIGSDASPSDHCPTGNSTHALPKERARACCLRPDRCCALADASRRGVAHMGGTVAEFFVDRRQRSSAFHARLREYVWTTHAPEQTDGALRLPRVAPRVQARRAAARAGRAADVVLFASSHCGTNRRQLLNEDEVATAVQAYLAVSHPSLCFVRVSLQALPPSLELRLLRRTRVYISLFGSSLQNCRFLPAEATVLQIMGAARTELASGIQLYDKICGSWMRLRWAVFVSAGNCEYDTAHVNVSAFVRFVDRALRGAWLRESERPLALAAARAPLAWRARVNQTWRHLCRDELRQAGERTQELTGRCTAWKQRSPSSWQLPLRTVLREANEPHGKRPWSTARAAAAANHPLMCRTSQNLAAGV